MKRKRFFCYLLVVLIVLQTALLSGNVLAEETETVSSTEMQEETGSSGTEEIAAEEIESRESEETMEEETGCLESEETMSEETVEEATEEETTALSESEFNAAEESEDNTSFLSEGQEITELFAAAPAVSYKAYVNGSGWNNAVTSGETCGKMDSGMLEAIMLSLSAGSYSGSDIRYSVHMQTYGWRTESGAGSVNGVPGSGKRIEAIKIRLTGKVADDYDVYYRTYVEGCGWLGWAKNGAPAGSSGLAKKMMAYQIVLVKKGAASPGGTNNAFLEKTSQIEAYPNTYSNTGDGVKDIVGVAKTQVGYQIAYEGLATKYGIWYNSYIHASGTYYNTAPWCAMFVTWCAEQAGISSSVFRFNASTVNQATWYQKTTNPGNWHDAKTGYNPQAGDLIFFKYATNSNYVNHVGLVEKSSGGRVYIIEGNSGNGVKSNSYALDYKYIVGYATPDYYHKGICSKVYENYVEYNVNVEGTGWSDMKADGDIAGTTGQAKRLQTIKIKLNDQCISGGITYRSYMQTTKWGDWKSNGAVSGLPDGTKRLEAFEIKLTGTAASQYDIYYRAHVQSYGWLDWAKNGAPAGTINKALRVEAVQIQLVKKGGSAPGATKTPYIEGEEPKPPVVVPEETPSVEYQVHCQTFGWMEPCRDGEVAGVVASVKRLEAIQINLKKADGGILYKTHVQSYGWLDWEANGNPAGTTGAAKRMEAIEIKLTGNAADKYDVYYRTYVQDYGWLGWTKNGESAGTTGYAKRLEAIQMVLVKKGEAAPGTTKNAFYSK